MKQKKYLCYLAVICILEIGIAFAFGEKNKEKSKVENTAYQIGSNEESAYSGNEKKDMQYQSDEESSNVGKEYNATSQPTSTIKPQNTQSSEMQVLQKEIEDAKKRRVTNNTADKTEDIDNTKNINNEFKVNDETSLYENYNDVIVTESSEVDEKYFEDAIFIGDSRMCAFKEMSDIEYGTFFTDLSLSIDKLDEKKINGKTLYETLEDKHFSKVYIGMGMKELGNKDPSEFATQYGNLIDKVKQILPDAIIYAQSILHVGAEKSESNKIYNNDNINSYNSAILSVIRKKGCYYLNINSILCENDKELKNDASNDGININAKYCRVILEYIKKYVIN